MKRINCFVMTGVAAIVLFSACKKSELPAYNQPDRIYFLNNYQDELSDSTTYSFAIKSASLMVDTVFVRAKIMGVAKDYDREVKLAVVDSLTTAIAGEEFAFTTAIVPAGAYEADIPVLVKRGADLKTETKRLTVKIIESKDFLPGPPHSAAWGYSYPGASTTYLIKINDFLSKPDKWDTFLKYFFGSYSQVKYAFVIQATGRAEFQWGGAGGLPYSAFSYYQQVCRNALEDYEAANGPLIDEFGNQVTF